MAFHAAHVPLHGLVALRRVRSMALNDVDVAIPLSMATDMVLVRDIANELRLAKR